jgi:hypothetical protein
MRFFSTIKNKLKCENSLYTRVENGITGHHSYFSRLSYEQRLGIFFFRKKGEEKMNIFALLSEMSNEKVDIFSRYKILFCETKANW